MLKSVSSAVSNSNISAYKDADPCSVSNTPILPDVSFAIPVAIANAVYVLPAPLEPVIANRKRCFAFTAFWI